MPINSKKAWITTDIFIERKNHLRTAMLEYCKKDTFIMFELVRWPFATCC